MLELGDIRIRKQQFLRIYSELLLIVSELQFVLQNAKHISQELLSMVSAGNILLQTERVFIVRFVPVGGLPTQQEDLPGVKVC